MTRVFVSFRNGDEPFAAATLYRALVERLGPTAVFRSSDCIPPGADWAQTIWDSHRQSDVVVVVIGPRWLTIADADGRPRLRMRKDWVRAEIHTALRDGKQVIPVMLPGAKRMTRADLPASIAGLAALQSVSMDHCTVEAAADRIAAEVISRHPEAARPTGPDVGRPPVERDAQRWLDVRNVPTRLPSFVGWGDQARTPPPGSVRINEKWSMSESRRS